MECLVLLTFDNIQDVRTAVDDIHLRSLQLKKSCINNIEQFVRRDPRLPAMLERIRQSGRKTFLLTNSDWWYTNNIMKHLLGGIRLETITQPVTDISRL